MLQTFHNLQDTARGYSLTQLLGRPTIRRYQGFVREHVPVVAGRRILEIGCGVGSARPWFADNYTGIDINPDYIEQAKQHFSGNFFVMDAGQIEFPPNSFDDAVSIATTHHLTDEQLKAMMTSATTVASSLHIIDAILPIAPGSWFKTTLFRMDRGRYVRTFDELKGIVGGRARLEHCQVVEGPLHDVGYIRASRLGT